MPIVSPDRLAPVEQVAAARMALRVEAPKVVDSSWTPQQQENIKAARKLVDQRDGAKASEVLATGFNYAATWEKTAEAQVQTGFNTGTGAREARPGSQEAVNLAEVKKKQGIYSEYLRDGYDGLKAGGGLSVVDKKLVLMTQVESFISANQYYMDSLPRDATGNIDYTALSHAIESMLRDPNFRNILAGKLNEVFDSAKLPKDMEANLTTAEAKLRGVDAEIGRLTPLEAADKAEKARQEGRKTNFDTVPYTATAKDQAGNPIPGGTKREVLTNLSNHGEIQAYQAAQQDLLRIIQAGTRGKNAPYTQADVQAAQAEVNKYAAYATVQEYKILTSENTDITTRLTDATRSFDATSKELLAKQGEKITVNAEVEALVLQREAKSVEFTNAVAGAVRGTAEEYVANRRQEIVHDYPQYRAEVAQELQAEADEKIKAELDKRWLKLGKKSGFGNPFHVSTYLRKDEWQRDIQKTTADMEMVLASVRAGHNPDQFVDKFLEDAGLTPEQRTLLRNDKTFMEVQGSSLVKKMFAEHVGAGGKIGTEFQSVLRVTPWGRKVSAEWIEQDAETKRTVEQLTGNPVSENSVEEVYKKKGEKGVSLLMLLLLGVFGAGEKLLK